MMAWVKAKIVVTAAAVAVVMGGGIGLAVNQQAIAQQASSAPSGWDRKFDATWKAATLTVTRYNAADPTVGEARSQQLQVQGALVVLDPAGIIALDRIGFTVTRILDDAGNDISRIAQASTRDSRWYGPLQYQHSFDSDTRQVQEKLSPSGFNIGITPTGSVPSRLSRVEGHVMVLTAERLENVDVPFNASEQATEIVPGFSVRFKEAKIEGNSYRYELAGSEPGRTSYRFSGAVSEHEPLPSRIVVEQYFISSDGEKLSDFRGSFPNPSGVSGSGGGGAQVSRIAAMRFVVAINPQERKVPVALTNIELPRPQDAPSLLLSSPPRALPPVERMEEALLRQLQDRRDNASRYHWNDRKDQRIRELWSAFQNEHDHPPMTVQAAPIGDLLPDVSKCDDYIGSYRAVPSQGIARASSAAAGTTRASAGPAETAAMSMAIAVRKDEHGRFVVDTPEGPSPAVLRNGAIFGVFDDVLIAPEDRLDPDSPPKLAGFWIIRSGGRTVLRMDTGRAQADFILERER